MTTLEQVKTYVQNHLVAVVATSVLALVSVSAIATTIRQTRKNEHQTGPLSIFNLKSYEGINKLFGSKEEKINDEKSENNGGENETHEEEPVKDNENQMQQPLREEQEQNPIEL